MRYRANKKVSHWRQRQRQQDLQTSVEPRLSSVY